MSHVRVPDAHKTSRDMFVSPLTSWSDIMGLVSYTAATASRRACSQSQQVSELTKSIG